MTGGIVQFVLWALAMVLVFRSVKDECRLMGEGVSICEYSMTIKCVGILLLALFVWMVVEYFSGEPVRTIADWRVPVMVGALAAVMSLEFFGRKILIKEDEVIFISPWSRRKTLKWAEIESVDHVGWAQAYRLTLTGGKKFWVPEMLSGATELVGKLLLRRGFLRGEAK